MIAYRFRPLRWEGPTTPADSRRGAGTFSASYQATLDLLDRELQHLDARDVVIEAGFSEQDIRQDGRPRANAPQPSHPGVRVAFDSRHGPLIYATDVHVRWQHNLRAVALGLQALRAVDRYGVTNRGEQYTGWRAIGAGPEPAEQMSVITAARYLAEHGGGTATEVLSDPEHRRRAYRAAARKLHPDMGGTEDAFQRLQQAADLVRAGA